MEVKDERWRMGTGLQKWEKIRLSLALLRIAVPGNLIFHSFALTLNTWEWAGVILSQLLYLVNSFRKKQVVGQRRNAEIYKNAQWKSKIELWPLVQPSLTGIGAAAD